MDHAERLARAARAKNELELTEGAFDQLRAALIDKWASTPIEAAAFRERIFGAVSALDTVRDMLRQATFDTAAVNNEIMLAQHGFQQ